LKEIYTSFCIKS